MSELIVVSFRDQFRAVDVLNELRQRNWLWVGDLEDAVAVRLDDAGHAKVQLSVDLSGRETVTWAGIWGSLLSVVLYLPTAEIMAEAADGVGHRMSREPEFLRSPIGTYPNASWWRDELGISDEFLRDVGAVIQTGTSAILMIVRTQEVLTVLRQLYDYGSLVIHTTLTPEQDEKMGLFCGIT